MPPVTLTPCTFSLFSPPVQNTFKNVLDMIETKRTAVLSEINEIPLRLLTREILHKQTVLGVLELNMLFTEQVNVCLSYSIHCVSKKTTPFLFLQ